jgi:hypothetical protein
MHGLGSIRLEPLQEYNIIGGGKGKAGSDKTSCCRIGFFQQKKEILGGRGFMPDGIP